VTGALTVTACYGMIPATGAVTVTNRNNLKWLLRFRPTVTVSLGGPKVPQTVTCGYLYSVTVYNE
jgi:hypothetical protein